MGKEFPVLRYPTISVISDLRIYHDISHHRWSDALGSFKQHNYLLSTYLAGYAAECMLKYVILKTLFPKRDVNLGDFKDDTHKLVWLTRHRLDKLIDLGNDSFEELDNGEIFKEPDRTSFKIITNWRSEWRYSIDRQLIEENHAKWFLEEVLELVSQIKKNTSKKLNIGNLTPLE